MSEIEPPVDTPTNGGVAPATTPPDPVPNPPKRHRRPSVRLGEIGDQLPYETLKKPNQIKQTKSSKTRHLETLDTFPITYPSKPKKSSFSIATKRIPSNWRTSKTTDNEELYDYDDADRYTDNSLNLSDDDDGNEMDQGGIRVRVRVSDSSDLDRNGVRVWLNQLGLSRYFSIFEVHEVDDEVLPLLTLEDLKDMGINAVGSRRKMFSSIKKLGKGFS